MKLVNNTPPTINIKDEHINSLVSNCSECSKDYINGEFNHRGAIHRMLQTDEWGNIDCRDCPVHLRSKSNGEFDRVLAAMDGEN